MFGADLHSARLAIRRGEIVETVDDGEHQVATARGYADEVFRRAHRAQAFGFSSRPPAGSHGIALLGNGRPDQSVLIGFEHPTHRPRSLGDGESVLYNAHGDVIFVYKKKIKTKTETWELEATTMVIKADIVHTGNMSTSGVHTDSNGTHK